MDNFANKPMGAHDFAALLVENPRISMKTTKRPRKALITLVAEDNLVEILLNSPFGCRSAQRVAVV